MKDRELSAKQAAFVTEYIKDWNGCQAAIRAGYSPKAAKEQAARLLTKANIQKAIKEYQDKASAEAEVNLAWWLKRMKQLADYDPRGFFDEHGNMKPVNKLDDACAAALAGLDVQEVPAGEGEIPAIIKRIKFTDRRAALDLIGKHLGAYVNELSIIQKLSDTEVDNLVNRLLDKMDDQ